MNKQVTEHKDILFVPILQDISGGIQKDLVLDKHSQLVLEFICKVCHDIAFNPLLCEKCQSMFCQKCLDQYLTRNSKCPNGCKFTEKQIDPLVSKILNKLELKCINHKNGCNQILTYQQFQNHVITCEYGMLKCIYPNCEYVGNNTAIQAHLNEHYTICQNCETNLRKDKIAEHDEITCLKIQNELLKNVILTFKRKNNVFRKLKKATRSSKEIEAILDDTHEISILNEPPIEFERVRQYSGKVDCILDLSGFKDGMICFNEDNKIHITDFTSRCVVGTLTGHKGTVKCIIQLLIPSFIATWAEEGTIKIWNLQTMKSSITFKEEGNMFSLCTYKPSPSILVSASLTHLNIYEWERNTCMQKIEISTIGIVKSILNANYFKESSVLLSDFQQIWLFDIDYHESQKKFRITKEVILCEERGFVKIMLNIGKLFPSNIIYTQRNKLYCLDLISHKLLFSLTGHKGEIENAIIYDNDKMASMSHDKTIRVWYLIKRECLCKYELDEYGGLALSHFSSRGHSFLTAGKETFHLIYNNNYFM